MSENQMKIRVPEALRNRIKAVAASNRRSMNAEILTILEQAVQKPSAETQNGDAVPA